MACLPRLYVPPGPVAILLCPTPDTANPETLMPYVNIQITAGATREQNSQLVRDVTNSLVHVLGKQPEHIHVVIEEIAEANWGFAGMLTDDWKKSQKK